MRVPGRGTSIYRRHSMHEIVNARLPVVGDKVERDAATHNQGKVQLGDGAPVFAPRSIRAGDKVMRDTASHNEGKVQLGDGAPVFAPASSIRAGDKVMRDAASHNRCEVQRGESGRVLRWVS